MLKSKKMCLHFVIMLVSFPMVLSAEEQFWRISAGAVYRGFDDVEFSGFQFRNFGQIDPAEQPLGIQGYTDSSFDNIARPFIFSVDHARYHGGEASIDSSDSWGPVISLERTVLREEDFSLAIAANIQYFSFNANKSARADRHDTEGFEVFNYRYQAIPGAIAPVYSDRQSGFASRNNTSISVRNEFDMDLYVFDIGLKGYYTPHHMVDLFVAAGPSLNYTDIETSQTQTASWTEHSPTPPFERRNSYRKHQSEDDTDWIFGAYFSLGGRLNFTRHIGLSVQARYDEAFGSDPGTSQASLDFSGFSGVLKLDYRF